MIECISCLYELQCDWTEAEAEPCGHYRPEPGYKKARESLDRKSLYIKIIHDLADVADLEVEGIISIKDKKDQTSIAVVMAKR